MSPRLAVVAEPAAASVAGIDGVFDWGEAVTAAPGAVPDADVVIALGAAEAEGAAMRWLGEPAAAPAPPGARDADAVARSAEPLDAATPAAGSVPRLVAPAGDGLWSRAPWPVRDDLFDTRAAGAGLLVVGDDPGLLAKLADRGIAHRAVAAPSADDVLAAAAVAFPPARRADGRYIPGSRQEAVPARAFAPLAARRPLILPRARITFGLLPGVDHLAASTDDDVAQYAAALLAHPDAFRIQVALGALAAERQRASRMYARLIA
jgi:hypothetical protein